MNCDLIEYHSVVDSLKSCSVPNHHHRDMNPIWCGVERVVIVKVQQLSFTRRCGKCSLRSQLPVYNIQRNVDTRARGTGDGGWGQRNSLI